MSAACLPFHYLSLHALISAPMTLWDTYNDGNTERRAAGANETGPGTHSGAGGDSHNKKEGWACNLSGLSHAKAQLGNESLQHAQVTTTSTSSPTSCQFVYG